MAGPTPGYFDENASANYDERNRKLAPIGDGMHFLIRLILDELPERARVLCVGVGTGAEILSLAQAHPSWTFVGVDPSAPMLEVGRRRLTEAGVMDRCRLVVGHVHELPADDDYDAALSVLVAHFIPRAERADYFRQICARLRPAGVLVNTEISGDLSSPQADVMIEQWRKVQALMGATPESLAGLPRALREMLHVLSPSETEAVLRDSGIPMPVPFFQSLMIHGWFGRRG